MKNFVLLAKIITVALCLVVLLGCTGGNDMVFTCNIYEGQTVISPEFSFTVSATCGGEDCGVSVFLNGELTAGGGSGNYTVQLERGQNKIVITASRYGREETKTYHVTYRADFKISTDIDQAVIVNQSISFTASATFNDLPCALIAETGGQALEEEGGVFTARLGEGENVVVLTARYGDLTEVLQRQIYCGEFTLNTNLTQEDRAEELLYFRAAAAYEGQLVPIEVTLNGSPVAAEGNRYELTLQPGQNRIVIAAQKDNQRCEYTYTVRYVNDSPTLKTSLKNGNVYRGSKLGFDVIATDGLGKKLPYNNISFSADFYGDGTFTPLSSVMRVWDDDALTSFLIDFKSDEFLPHANSEFDFKITACDGAGRQSVNTYKMTYVPAQNGEQTGEVVFALEGFSIGCGYFIAPCRLPVYEGINFAQTLTEVIEEHGWTYTCTGRIDSGFYLAGINGLDLTGNRIPDELWELLPGRAYQSMPKPENGEEYELSEFCYAQGGGWMYSVNTVYKNFGFSDYYPQDGDVIRVQFTVALGNDLGGGGAMGGGSTSWLSDNPDYGPIMGLLADIALTAQDKTVYNSVLNEIARWNISQKTMDEQLKILTEAYGGV